MEKEFLINEINRLKKEHNAIILAHYYTTGDIQEIADFVGDSLALSQVAAKNDADMIIFAGVNFMAETAKILSPDKIVISPDTEAGCSLADSCDATAFAKFIDEHPNHTVVSYVNTSVEVKALTDIVCTSSNAVKIVDSIPKEQAIIFGPDRNLGSYVKIKSGRENMLIWDGACHVHEEFSLEGILRMQDEHPNAKTLAHPECKRSILEISDHVGSTAEILRFAKEDSAKEFIIVTEAGILHQLQKECPDKILYSAPAQNKDGSSDSCHCNMCPFMKLVTIEKIYTALKELKTEIFIDEEIRKRAEISIIRMLELS